MFLIIYNDYYNTVPFCELIIYVSSINKIFLDKRFIKKSKIFDHIINVIHQLIKDINKKNHLKIKNKKYSVSFNDEKITLFYGEEMINIQQKIIIMNALKYLIFLET